MSTSAWYVLRTISGCERSIANQFREWDDFDGFCPTRSEAGKTKVLWPTYTFGMWPMTDENWQRVLGERRPTRVPNDMLPPKGILSIIGGSSPTKIPQETLDFWIERADDEGMIIDWGGVLKKLDEKLLEERRGFVKGSAVRIHGGRYAAIAGGCPGTCLWFDEKGVKVSTVWFNRETPVYIADTDEEIVLPDGESLRTSSAKRRARARLVNETRAS